MSKQETKADTAVATGYRPVGLSIASFFYAASGVYYLAYPIAAQNTGIWFLYVIGVLSLLGSYGVLKMTRWGLWLGLGMFGPQVVVSGYALMTVLSGPGLTSPITIGFIASLAILLFFASLTFLLILDKRRSFK